MREKKFFKGVKYEVVGHDAFEGVRGQTTAKSAGGAVRNVAFHKGLSDRVDYFRANVKVFLEGKQVWPIPKREEPDQEAQAVETATAAEQLEFNLHSATR